jgi:exodeoxyribonuclease-3
MRIISWNVNGLRSVYRKSLLNWLSDSDIDIVCLQEIKAQKEQLDVEVGKFFDYKLFINSGMRMGYSGVAIYSRTSPRAIRTEFGFTRFDNEGRGIEVVYSDFTLVNLYLPHGGWEKQNLSYKLAVYDFLIEYLESKRDQNLIITGDFNIAHSEIDLARPKQNFNNTMFTTEERRRVDKILSLGFVDCFRRLHPDASTYTWWSYRPGARERNIGWRIDYSLISASLVPSLRSASILHHVLGSDHCPIELYLS